MKRICVFDVNETLLDLSPMFEEFKRVFGDERVGKIWFGQMIQSSLVSIITDNYKTFGEIGGAALEMVAEQQGANLSSGDKTAILSTIKKLPPHPEVEKSLARLKKAGFTLVSLTNSTEQVVEAQLKNAKLTQYFEKMFSADTVRRLKPAREPYQMVAEHFEVEMDNLRLIAAHGWDIAGALHAGCKAAFIARSGKILDPLGFQPDIVGEDLGQVVYQILAKDIL